VNPLSVGAAILIVCLSLAFLILRRLVQPADAVPGRGRHRAPWWLLRPTEVTRRCPAEDRNTVHARTPWRGELVCRSCSQINGGAR
jgi:hypothetical protein